MIRADRAARILFVDKSTKLKSTADLKTSARGGMVTSLFRVSDYLQQSGFDVQVLSDIKVTGYSDQGVEWIDEPEGSYDVLIANRGVGTGYDYIKAKRRILWTHDLPHAGFIPNPKTIRAFDTTIFMSVYAEIIWRSFFHTIGGSEFIPNGIDKNLFYFDPLEKDPDYLIYASAPNRGVQKLPFIFDGIQAAMPERQLRMNAYSNMSKLHPGEADYEIDYKEFEESSVVLLDPVPQHEFAQELRKASLMILPTSYPEICSNTVLQAIACGTPIVTTGSLGATNEWVKHKKTGMLTMWQPQDYMIYWLEIIRYAKEILSNRKQHEKMMLKAAKTRILSWEENGEFWKRLIKKKL